MYRTVTVHMAMKPLRRIFFTGFCEKLLERQTYWLCVKCDFKAYSDFIGNIERVFESSIGENNFV